MTFKEYNSLVDEMRIHAKLFYVEDEAVLPDHIYDLKYKKLLVYENTNENYIRIDSPTQYIGYPEWVDRLNCSIVTIIE